MKKWCVAALSNLVLVVCMFVASAYAPAPTACAGEGCDTELVCSSDEDCEPCHCVGRPLGRCQLEPALAPRDVRAHQPQA